MVIASLLVVAATVACSMTFAAPIFSLFDSDICDDCSEESDLFTGLMCDLMCESVEECSSEQTTKAGGSTTGGETTTGGSTTAAGGDASTTAGGGDSSTAGSTTAAA